MMQGKMNRGVKAASDMDLGGLTGHMAQALAPNFSETQCNGAASTIYLSLEVLMGIGQVQCILDEVEHAACKGNVPPQSYSRLCWAGERLKALQHASELAETAERSMPGEDGQRRCLAIAAALSACAERQARLQQKLSEHPQLRELQKPAVLMAAEFLGADRSGCLGRKDICNDIVNDLFAEEFVLAMRVTERFLRPVASLIDIINPLNRGTALMAPQQPRM